MCYKVQQWSQWSWCSPADSSYKRFLQHFPLFKSILIPIHFYRQSPLFCLLQGMISSLHPGTVENDYLLVSNRFRKIFSRHFVWGIICNKKRQIDCALDMSKGKFVLRAVINKSSTAFQKLIGLHYVDNVYIVSSVTIECWKKEQTTARGYSPHSGSLKGLAQSIVSIISFGRCFLKSWKASRTAVFLPVCFFGKLWAFPRAVRTAEKGGSYLFMALIKSFALSPLRYSARPTAPSTRYLDRYPFKVR